MIKRYNLKEIKTVELIAKNFKLIRQSLNQSRDEIAQFFEVSGQQIAKYEDGKDRISAAKLFMYSQAFKIPMARFFSNNLLDDSQNSQEDIAKSFKRLSEKDQVVLSKLIKSLDHIDVSS